MFAARCGSHNTPQQGGAPVCLKCSSSVVHSLLCSSLRCSPQSTCQVVQCVHERNFMGHDEPLDIGVVVCLGCEPFFSVGLSSYAAVQFIQGAVSQLSMNSM